MNTHIAPRWLAATGILSGILYYIGGHVLQPTGDPSQGMKDTEIIEWARDSYGALWAGGVVSIISALLILTWGVVLADRLDTWADGRAVPHAARASVALTAGVLGIAGIMQVLSGAASMPGEPVESQSVVPVLAILYGNLAASAWCLLAPAAACVALSDAAPRWMRITSGVSAVPLIATAALPPVSWPFGMLWVIVISVGLLTTSAEVRSKI